MKFWLKALIWNHVLAPTVFYNPMSVTKTQGHYFFHSFQQSLLILTVFWRAEITNNFFSIKIITEQRCSVSWFSLKPNMWIRLMNKISTPFTLLKWEVDKFGHCPVREAMQPIYIFQFLWAELLVRHMHQSKLWAINI